MPLSTHGWHQTNTGGDPGMVFRNTFSHFVLWKTDMTDPKFLSFKLNLKTLLLAEGFVGNFRKWKNQLSIDPMQKWLPLYYCLFVFKIASRTSFLRQKL